MKLIVTIPALNEEKTIAQVIRGVPRDIPEISETEVIVVNDGSTDRTAELAREAGALVITLKGGGGLGTVFKTGLERAMRRGADIIVNIDGDGQFNPQDVRKLIEPLLNDEADFVTCTRFADPALRPKMPLAKYWGNQAVTRIINNICGGTRFTDVSCGFRAFTREAAYRLTLFGRYTYTQETFIDLFSKGVRMAEVPLKVRGVREFGKSRVASNLWKYASNSFPIMLRAMRDIQPLKFFGSIALMLFLLSAITLSFVGGWYFFHTHAYKDHGVLVTVHQTSPFSSLIPISGVLVVLAFLMGALALLADMLGRHRRITEEVLYLMRRRMYAAKGRAKAGAGAVLAEGTAAEVAGAMMSPAMEGGAMESSASGLLESAALEEADHEVPAPQPPTLTLHDSWCLPVYRSVPRHAARNSERGLVGHNGDGEHGPELARDLNADVPARAMR